MLLYTHAVTATSTATNRDDYGDSTTADTSKVVTGVLFAPEGVAESTASNSPAVVGEASLYGGFPRLDADDSINHAAPCCDGRDFALGVWQVVGGSRGWGGPDMMVVPIKRTSES